MNRMRSKPINSQREEVVEFYFAAGNLNAVALESLGKAFAVLGGTVHGLHLTGLEI